MAEPGHKRRFWFGLRAKDKTARIFWNNPLFLAAFGLRAKDKTARIRAEMDSRKCQFGLRAKDKTARIASLQTPVYTGVLQFLASENEPSRP